MTQINKLAEKIQSWDITKGKVPQEWLDEYGRLWAEELKEKTHREELKSKEMRNRKGRGRYGERRLADKVGGIVVGRSKFIITRNGTSIKINCQRPPDVITSLFAFESKYFTRIPASIKKIMTQAITNAPDGLIPVGVLADREEHSTYYILMEKDWLALHGKEVNK